MLILSAINIKLTGRIFFSGFCKKIDKCLKHISTYFKRVHFYRLTRRKYKFFRQIICKTKAHVSLRLVNIFNYDRQHFTEFHSIFRKFLCHFLFDKMFEIFLMDSKKN